MKRARFTRQARAELLAQTAYYEALQKGLGSRFRTEVETTAKMAASFPLHGKPGVAGTLRRLIADFPFKIFYTESAYGVLIHADAGDQQAPEYWLGRLRSEG